MDNIKITKIEDSEAITITRDEYDSTVIEVIDEMLYDIPPTAQMLESLIATKFSILLSKKLFKEDN